ncbi:MAG: hypothetical protein P1U65_07660 [Minwuia sp.]|nr:hypothetical protein [Minwuia sp.]
MARRRKGRVRVVAARVVTGERRQFLQAVLGAAEGVRVRPAYRVSPYRETAAQQRVRQACLQAGWVETVWGHGAWRLSSAAFNRRFPDQAARAKAWQQGWRPVGDRITDLGREVLGCLSGAPVASVADVEGGAA